MFTHALRILAKLATLSLLLTIFSSQALVQHHDYITVKPGDAALNVSSIRPHSAKYRMMQGGQETAIVIVELRQGAQLGKPTFRLVWDLGFQGQHVYDQVILHKQSLAPLLQILPCGLGEDWGLKVAIYQDEQMIGSITSPKQDALKRLNVEFDQPVFEGGTHHLILSALPLRENYAVQLPTGDENGIKFLKARVLGRETITVDGMAYSTWKLRITQQMGEQSMDSKLWLIQQPPYLIKRETPKEIGIVWELVELLHEGAW